MSLVTGPSRERNSSEKRRRMDDPKGNPIADEQQQTPPVDQSQSGEQTPEELEWAKMGGRTRDRIRQLIHERDEWRNTAQAAKQTPPEPIQPTVVPPPSVQNQFPGQLTPEQELAIENLRKFGIWTKKDQEEFEKKQEQLLQSRQQAVEDEVLIETEYARLEAAHNGSDGLPAFDRNLIEEHMKATGVYNPEKAYEDLYRDEIFDAWSRKSNAPSRDTYSEKPKGSTTAGTEPLTLAGLQERLRQPDGKDWWDKNRDRLLPQVGELLK